MPGMLHPGAGLPLENAIPGQLLVSIATCGRGRRAWTGLDTQADRNWDFLSDTSIED